MPKQNFTQLINTPQPVLIDFYATWCGPCKFAHTILVELKKQIGEKASIIKIDVDKNKELSQQFNVKSVPTLMLFKNGQLMWRQSGIVPVAQLKQVIEKHSDTEVK